MSTELINHLRAGFPAFWIATNEPERVKTDVANEVKQFTFKDGSNAEVLHWSVLDGKPDIPLINLTQYGGRAVMFLYNYHWFIKQPAVIQTIQESFPVWASEGKAIVIVSPLQEIPPELEKDITLISLPLPTTEEISEVIASQTPDNDGFKAPTKKELKTIITNSKGLTKRELQNVYNLSIVENGKFDHVTINDYRSQAVKKSGLATVLPPDVKPEQVIGYDVARDHVMSTINNPEAKGTIFIGPPGCGKTMLIKSFIYASKKIGIAVNTGQLFSKYQGETDKNVRALIELAKALGDSYFIFDEIEKQFAGVGGSGDLDSGVTSRALSQFLEFFQNRPKGCYIGATANSFRGLPPEYLRAGRWDTAPIYIGLPSSKIRKQIMSHYIKKFELSAKQVKSIPKTEKWSGAEIEALCHNASMKESTLMEASEFIMPQYVTMGEEIKALEEWAKGRTIPAERIPTSKVIKVKSRKIDM